MLDAGDTAAEFSGDYSQETPQLTRIFMIIMFIAATFFTQITMLNMLIAIMGDTFEQLNEIRAIN